MDQNTSLPQKIPSPQGKSLGLQVDKRAIPWVKDIIVVASGKGGVGKSTLSVNLAAFLSVNHLKVGLLDADIYGPSIPKMMGCKHAKISERSRLIPELRHGISCMSIGMIEAQALLWRGPLVSKAFKQLCYETDWPELDYLILDLPPGTGDIQMTMLESLPILQAIIVTTPQDIALIDAKKAVDMFQILGVPILGVVENMATFHCPKCHHSSRIFASKLERFLDQTGLTKIASLPLHEGISLCAENGVPAFMEYPELFDWSSFLTLKDRVLRLRKDNEFNG